MIVQFKSVNNQLNARVAKLPPFIIPLLYVVFSIWIFTKVYGSYDGDLRPQGVHSWAQSDRFSIARNYYDNGLNFFEPQTNYLEFSKGKTGVEFPALQYLTAVIAKVFGARDQLFLIYRLLCFVFFSLSGFFLLRIIRMHGGNAFQQLFIPAFYLASPVLLYYGFSFLPDLPALAFILLSYFYFEKFRLKFGFQNIYLAIGIGFFASLLKLTAAIFPVAYLLWFVIESYFYQNQITKIQKIKVIGLFLIGLLTTTLVTYYFSIRANTIYKSGVFLSQSRHINHWDNFGEIANAIKCWFREYFREGQYWVIGIALLVSFNPKVRQKDVWRFKGILFLGILFFLFMMGKQLIDHDYYVICTLIPALIIFSLDGIMLLSSGCFGGLALIFLVNHLYPLSFKQIKQRHAEVYSLSCFDVNAPRAYMLEASDWFNKKQIDKSKVVFVLYDYPLNTPLVYLDRKGMVINREKMKHKKLVNQWFGINPPQYLVIPLAFMDQLAIDRADIANRSQLLYKGKSVVIYHYGN